MIKLMQGKLIGIKNCSVLGDIMTEQIQKLKSDTTTTTRRRLFEFSYTGYNHENEKSKRG